MQHKNYVKVYRSVGFFRTSMKISVALILLAVHVDYALLAKSPAKSCASHEFQCENGACIPAAGHCNDSQDCADGSDESGCDYFLCKEPFWYRCRHETTCISGSSRCDKQKDCLEGDDEENCDNYEVPHKAPVCSKAEFTCTDKACIPADLVCDGVHHCLDGSDETIGCIDIAAKCKGFLCRNKHCLKSSSWVCDGQDDCGDGSDEEHCLHECTLEHGKFECHNNHTCIDVAQVCNGADDCGDGSDESASCKSDACKKLKCAPQTCKVMPDGKAVCLCGVGFKFDAATGKCQDVNECARYGLCSQGCINTPGSFRCTCIDQFTLMRDGRTCELSTGTEALMLYTTQKSVGAMYLTSMHQYYVAKELSQVIGVSYDGMHVYWTDISHKTESIERSLEDGSDRQLLLTAGLISPEDLVLDWLTGNIYFSDSGQMHIAVCSSDGYHCKAIIQDQLHKPRGLALLPQNGTIFFSDWGNNAMIGRARMDGSEQTVVVNSGIHWPNGLTLDWPNERLYWIDAKLKRIESMHFDGSDRVVVLSDVLKHPFSVAVFNDRLYWSDWDTKSIQSCDKFTGKMRQTLVRDRMIFDVHIYHSSIQPKVSHACVNHTCSHLCLLTSNATYACACPQGMELHRDKHSCVNVAKRQDILLGIGHYLVTLKHHLFGRHETGRGEQLFPTISKMAFNSLNGEVFIADNVQHAIFTLELASLRTRRIVSDGIGMITALAFDYLSNTLYWADAKWSTIVIYSLQTQHRAIVQHYLGDDAPVALALVPEIGKMFIALRSTSGHTHIDRQDMTGRGPHAHVIEDRLGSNGTISFAVDHDLRAIFWSDMGKNRIEITSYEGDTRHLFREYLRQPVSVAIVGNELFWTCYGSQRLYWSDKHNVGTTKRINIQLPPNMTVPEMIPIIATQPTKRHDHPCLKGNGGCSHICVSAGLYASACVCPTGMVFNSSVSKVCINASDCEFRCESGECLKMKQRCNGHVDCKDQSDEQNCDPGVARIAASCRWNEFRCTDGSKCIPMERRCDKHHDCADLSDEANCAGYDRFSKCSKFQFTCANGFCIDATGRCDGVSDCADGSDELGCTKLPHKQEQTITCSEGMFQCNSGQCIPAAWECDGSPDCNDASDEHETCHPATPECPAGYFRCALGFCIKQSVLCDGNDDCGDGSDEENCPSDGVREGQCQAGDYTNSTVFHCGKSNTCLDVAVRCNGTAECPHGEDEAGCTNCGIRDFQCDDGQCIRLEWRCDKDVDCDDGSDELNCTSSSGRATETFHSTNCGKDTFECKAGECIQMSALCDGKRDCSNGHDEDGNCQSACLGGLGPCAQICQKSPTGSICDCLDGYELAGDKKNCVDLNECDARQPCAQICTNVKGSYRCSCHEGFMLRADKTSCKAIGAPQHVLYTTVDQVRKLTVNPPQIETLLQVSGSRVTTMDINIRQQKLYFATKDSAALYELNLKTNTTRVLTSVGTPDKVSVDWIASNVYFVDAEERSIKVCSFEREACARVISFTQRTFVKALALDPLNKFMFYSLLYSWIFQVPHSIIFKAKLDGTLQEVVTKQSALVSAIAVDPQSQLLYYTELSGKTLCRVNYYGQQQTVLVRDQPHVLNHPLQLSVFENQALIVNEGSATIGQCQLFAGYKCDRFDVNVPPSKQVLLVQESRQPMANNWCDTKLINCTHLCIPEDAKGKCVCENGLEIREGDRCPKPQDKSRALTPFRVASTHADQSLSGANDEQESTGSFLSFMSYAVLIAAMCGIGFYVYWQRYYRSSKFDVGIQFKNTELSTVDISDVELSNVTFQGNPAIGDGSDGAPSCHEDFEYDSYTQNNTISASDAVYNNCDDMHSRLIV
ncbi:putative vitellogenin receptor [Anopheles maculipalpis]|uniref:putative vitellogenin receptor n=1 Tax=Anopheles maculipalpis TaxID=1496333 RepID=UPI00215935AA|nr:putative vitellogenin receptor [Anopheles maculipalpis]